MFYTINAKKVLAQRAQEGLECINFLKTLDNDFGNYISSWFQANLTRDSNTPEEMHNIRIIQAFQDKYDKKDSQPDILEDIHNNGRIHSKASNHEDNIKAIQEVLNTKYAMSHTELENIFPGLYLKYIISEKYLIPVITITLNDTEIEYLQFLMSRQDYTETTHPEYITPHNSLVQKLTK